MAGGFATTQWSEVLAARDGFGTEAHRALASLCEAYWEPIYAYLRRKGHDAETASDLTQGFLLGLLERDSLKTIDPSKGRFRSFLLASLHNFLAHERDRAGAQKRGGRATTLSLDTELAENRFRREPVERLTPEQVFERRWALAAMERAMGRLRSETEESRGRAWFDRLWPYLTGSQPRVPYRRTAAELGTSEGAVKAAVYRLRQRYGVLLRDEVAQTVGNPVGDLDDELRYLLTAVESREVS